jgi:hypothetical protein
MRLFGYIMVFADDVRDDGRTIWHHTRWGRGGPQHEVYVCWGRGGLAVTIRHCCGPAEGRRGPSPAGPRCRGPARGRGHSSPAVGPHCHGPTRGRSPTWPRCRCPTGGRGGPNPAGPLSYPILQAKPYTHHMCAQDQLFHTHRH